MFTCLSWPVPLGCPPLRWSDWIGFDAPPADALQLSWYWRHKSLLIYVWYWSMDESRCVGNSSLKFDLTSYRLVITAVRHFNKIHRMWISYGVSSFFSAQFFLFFQFAFPVSFLRMRCSVLVVVYVFQTLRSCPAAKRALTYQIRTSISSARYRRGQRPPRSSGSSTPTVLCWPRVRSSTDSGPS